jgi:shikimate kinase
MFAMKISGNFILIGLMGSGKTTVGRLLAQRLGKTFVDSDHEIEKKTGVSIRTIFDLEGEARFRERERQVILELSQRRDIVLATGGGAILSAENRKALAASGVVIYLTTTVDEILARTRRDTSRPLLQQANRKEVLEALLVARDPLYREIAQITTASRQSSVQAFVKQLEKKLILYTNSSSIHEGEIVDAQQN